MNFRKYQHLEKFGSDDVENINLGECYVFPKIDGTNGSLWRDNNGTICAGSRNRELELDNDNQGFYNKILENDNMVKFFDNENNYRLYGEFLIPHSLKTYREDAWRKFYVFDVIEENGDDYRYLPYDEYKILLEKYDIDFIPCLTRIKNGSYEQFVKLLDKNYYLINDGQGVGEGIVIKNYNYTNKYGRIVWAKIVRSEFKDLHRKTMGEHVVEGKKIIEDEIVNKYLTSAMIDKVYQKIKNDTGWNSESIPRLLGEVYHDLVSEEIWNFVKKNKYPTINFKTLQYFSNQKVKEVLKELF
jgi:hypothetical protein